MTAINTAELNRPGVMSSYSSSGRKNNIHASKRQVAGSTFNQARLTAATKFLSPSKGGHVSARSIFSNGAPRYMSGQEMAMQFNRQSGQVSAFQSNNFISSGFNPIGMGNMFGMGMDPTIGTIMGLTNIGMSVLDKLGVFGKLNAAPAAQTNGQQVDNILNTAVTLTPDNVDFTGVSQGISDAKTPEDLSKAIASGHAKLASMDGMTATYEAAVQTENQQKDKLGEQKAKAEGKLQDANGAVEAKQTDVTKAQKGVNDKKNEASKFGEAYQKANDGYVDAHNKHIDAQNATKASQKAFDNATKEYNNAVSEFGKATQAATDATNAYNAEPAVDKNGNPNPKKDQLRAKMNLAIEQKNKAEEAKTAAERAKNDAQTKLNDAKTAETAAKNNETTAKGDLDNAKQNVTQNKQELAQFEKDLKVQMDALDDAKGELNNAKIDQQTAQTNLNNITTQIESANGAQKLLEQHQNNRAKLADEIKQGEARLPQLKQEVEAEDAARVQQQQQTQQQTQGTLTAEEKAQLGTPTETFEFGGKTYACYTKNDGTIIYTAGDHKLDEGTYNSMKSYAGIQ